MSDSHSLDRITSYSAGPTDLGEPKTKPIAPAPDDPRLRAAVSAVSDQTPIGTFTLGRQPAAISTDPEVIADTAPVSPCRVLGHSWARDPKESGTGQPGHAARHYSCNREGCGCTQNIAWDGDRWIATVSEPTDDNRKAPGA